MHLKTLGIPEHNMGKKWQVEFHEDFLSEFKLYSEAVRRQVYSLIEVLMVWSAVGQTACRYAEGIEALEHEGASLQRR